MSLHPPEEREPANGHAQMLVVDGDYLTTPAPPESRHGALGAAVKRVVARLIRFHTYRQDAINESHRAEIERLQARLTVLEAATAQRFARTDAEVAGVRRDLYDAAADFAHIAERVRAFENVRRVVDRLGPFRREVRTHRAEQIALKQQLTALSARLTYALRESAPLRREMDRLRAELEQAGDDASTRLAALEETSAGTVAGLERAQEAIATLRAAGREAGDLAGMLHRRVDEVLDAFRREEGALSGTIAEHAALLRNMSDDVSRMSSAMQHLDPRRLLDVDATLTAQRERLDLLAADFARTAAVLAVLPDAETLERVESRMADLAGAFNTVLDDMPTREKQRAVGSSINEVIARIEQLAADVDVLRRRLTATPYVSLPMEEWNPQRRSTPDDFDYVGFEQIFRGSEELVRERLRAYVPMLKGHAPVIEIGSGRGEFLELMRAAKIKTAGVDLNAGAVARCREKGLKNVAVSDGNAYLESLAEGSVGAVFSAQFAEHISFTELLRFLTLSRSRLVPGGLFVAETVNPNSIEGAKTFYVDPTHQKPLFPEVFAFLCLSAGFASVRLFYPNGGGFDETDPTSQHEYAVVATA